MFYTYVQTNTGGEFDFDNKNGVANFVIIEADTAKEANKKAIEIGLYFDGVAEDRDCECCGDRWYEYDETDGGTEFPEIYGEILEGSIYSDNYPSLYPNKICGYIHYKNGEITSIRYEKK